MACFVPAIYILLCLLFLKHANEIGGTKTTTKTDYGTLTVSVVPTHCGGSAGMTISAASSKLASTEGSSKAFLVSKKPAGTRGRRSMTLSFLRALEADLYVLQK